MTTKDLETLVSKFPNRLLWHNKSTTKLHEKLYNDRDHILVSWLSSGNIMMNDSIGIRWGQHHSEAPGDLRTSGLQTFSQLNNIQQQSCTLKYDNCGRASIEYLRTCWHSSGIRAEACGKNITSCYYLTKTLTPSGLWSNSGPPNSRFKSRQYQKHTKSFQPPSNSCALINYLRSN